MRCRPMVQKELDAGQLERLGIERAAAGLLVQSLLLLGALNPPEVARHRGSPTHHFNTTLADNGQSLVTTSLPNTLRYHCTVKRAL